MSGSDCLTESQLASFLAGEGDEVNRGELELHLSRCAACRHRLVEAHRLAEPVVSAVAEEALKQRVRGLPQTDRRRMARSWLAAAAVALVAGAGALWWQSEVTDRAADSTPDAAGQAGSQSVWRADAAVSPKLEILTPTPAGEISSLELSWRPVDRIGPYTVTFLDELGNVVWQVDAEQETWRTDEYPLASGRQYFWFVSAPIGQQERVESEVSSFVLAP